MNIKDAKEQIKNAMTAYFTKDAFGNYKIPIEKQRPIFLMGPPGVGKTAIMEQIAAELGVGLVSYSMTHHTRQSALGLPYIVQKEYGGKEYSATEYTMSEIIGAVYDLMRKTGLKEGILFLDEINCVSETLAPCMLQFLQYKVFGQHRVPDGWIVVTAGNPPEYNKSVRSFDIVTWDRLKRIDVEADYEIWKEYAAAYGVHPAITTYLNARKKDFYLVETTGEGVSFVTARGWDDLSQMLKLYEEHHLKVDEKLIAQYLQNKRIAKDFAIYYDLFSKYKNDYKIDTILMGKPSEEVLFRAKNVPFDEKLSLLAIIFDAIAGEITEVMDREEALTAYVKNLKNLQRDVAAGKFAEDSLKLNIKKAAAVLEKGRLANSTTKNQQKLYQQVIALLEKELYKVSALPEKDTADAVMGLIKADLAALVWNFREQGAKTGEHLNNVFYFVEEAWGESEEMLLLVTELTAHKITARFISTFGCDQYYEHNKNLDFQTRHKDILQRIEMLHLEQ